MHNTSGWFLFSHRRSTRFATCIRIGNKPTPAGQPPLAPGRWITAVGSITSWRIIIWRRRLSACRISCRASWVRITVRYGIIIPNFTMHGCGFAAFLLISRSFVWLIDWFFLPFFPWLISGFIAWLVDQWIVRVIDRLLDWLIDCVVCVDWLISGFFDIFIDRLIDCVDCVVCVDWLIVLIDWLCCLSWLIDCVDFLVL